MHVLRFDGNEFISAASSNYPHYLTSLGKLNEGLVAISGETISNEVEIFSNGDLYSRIEKFTQRKVSYS